MVAVACCCRAFTNGSPLRFQRPPSQTEGPPSKLPSQARQLKGTVPSGKETARWPEYPHV